MIGMVIFDPLTQPVLAPPTANEPRPNDAGGGGNSTVSKFHKPPQLHHVSTC